MNVHRTQSGKLHRVMKAMMPKRVFSRLHAARPLLKKDKATSMEVFGGYIHTYKSARQWRTRWCWIGSLSGQLQSCR